MKNRHHGQATVEYILILLIAVILAVLVIRDLVRPTITKMSDYISKVVEDTLFTRGNMHRYRH